MTHDEKHDFLTIVYEDRDVKDIVNKVNNTYEMLRNHDVNNV